MKNVNLIFWVKAISLVANFGSTRPASTSVVHKQKIKKSNFLTPRPPLSGLNSFLFQSLDRVFFTQRRRHCLASFHYKRSF